MLFILELINFTPYGDVGSWLPIALCAALLKLSHYASRKIKPTVSTGYDVLPRQQGAQEHYLLPELANHRRTDRVPADASVRAGLRRHGLSQRGLPRALLTDSARRRWPGADVHSVSKTR